MKKFCIIVAFLLVSSSIFAQLNEGFEGTSFPPLGWKIVDQDGDGNNWFSYSSATAGYAHTGSGNAFSASYDDANSVALTPTNYLITPKLIVTALDSIAYWFAPLDNSYPEEHYEIKVSTTGTNPADFTTTLYSYTITFADTLVGWQRKAHSLAQFANDTIYIAFIHTACTDQYYLKLDDVTGPSTYIFSNDLEVTSLEVPTGILYPGNLSLKAYLKNDGTQPQAAGKVVTFYNGTTVIGTATTTAVIAPGAIDSVIYTWANTTAGSFIIKAEVATDQDNSNNSATANLTVYPTSLLIESFEGITALPPTGWSNPEAWSLGTNPVNAYEGSQYAYVPATTASAKLITPKLEVVAGDSISFMAYTLATASYPTIKIQYSTNKVIWTDVTAANFTLAGSYAKYTAHITNAGIYYFAFTCANSSASSARMDFVTMPKLAPADTNDFGVTQIIEPVTGTLTATTQVKIKVKNYTATSHSNIPVVCKVNSQELNGIIAGPVAGGAEVDYTFTSTANMATLGSYTLKAYTSLSGDQLNVNDTLIKTVVCQPAASITWDFNQGIPSSFALINDANIAHVAAYTNAWIAVTDTAIITGDSCAASTSWFDPAGVADRWMITAKVALTTGNYLKWNARAFESGYPDGYLVKLSTTGKAKADFTVTLQTVAAEVAAWQTHMVDLSAYNGQNVYIAFVQNSNDMSHLRVDNIQILGSAALGINEVAADNSNFNIYPNPVKNELNITSVAALKNVKIINALGQEIVNEKVSGNHYKINTSSYIKGIYFVQIESEKGKTTKKFVVSE